MIDAYHITKLENLKSIREFGLVPNYGDNSKSAKDKTPAIFFTTKEYIDDWIRIFNHNKENIIILTFKSKNEGSRIGENNDLYTKKIVPKEEIFVVDNSKKIPLEEYYRLHKEKFDKLAEKALIKRINKVLNIFSNIKNKKHTYKENDLIETLDMLGCFISLDIEVQKTYLEILEIIKDKTLKLINLSGLDKEHPNYLKISQIFEKVKNKELNMKEINDLKFIICYGFDHDPSKVNKIDLIANSSFRINDNIKYK